MATLYVLRGPDKGCTFHIDRERVIVGRYSTDVGLTDHAVSRRHAEIRHTATGWEVADLGSANGTYVNGDRINDVFPVRHGDQIKIGGTLIVFGGNNEPAEESGSSSAAELIEVASSGGMDTSILSAVQPGEENMVVATPEAAEAVRAWNMLYQLAEVIGSIGSMHDLLERVSDIIVEHLPADRVFILMRRHEGGKLKPAIVRRRKSEGGRHGPITASKTIVNHVLETKNGVLCANATSDARFAQDPRAASLQSLALRSVVCVPIIAHEVVQGVIHLDCAMSRHTYTREQLRLTTAVGRMCGLAIENLRLMEARMQNERLAAVGEAVAYLSHHIRNILQGLRSGADVVEMSLRKEDFNQLATGWQVVNHNLDRIFQLTTNMLTFSKDRAPRMELCQLSTIIEDVLELARRQAQHQGVDIETDLVETPPALLDPEGIHQAVLNVLLNAIAACPAANGRVYLRTAYDALKDELVIAVSDNGAGIPPDQVESMFRPFYSSKGQGGTGLGLAATKKIIDELRGRIDVQSAPGTGTSITISLPCVRDDDTDSEATR